jgi:hypothetical protein
MTMHRVVQFPVALLALACQSGTAPFSPFLNSHFAYTIVYSDSGPRSYTGSFGGFAAYAIKAGSLGGRWATVYFIGDSLVVTQVLPANTQCPIAANMPIGTTALATDSDSVMVRHKRLHPNVPDPLLSSLTIDSIAVGQVWGHFTMGLRPVVPEFSGGVSATLTGTFRVAEIASMGLSPHCTKGAA